MRPKLLENQLQFLAGQRHGLQCPVDGGVCALAGFVVARMINNYNQGFSANATFWYFAHIAYTPDFVSGVGASNFTFGHEGIARATPTTAVYALTNPYQLAAFRDATYIVAVAMAAGGKAEGETSNLAVSLQSVVTRRREAIWPEATLPSGEA